MTRNTIIEHRSRGSFWNSIRAYHYLLQIGLLDLIYWKGTNLRRWSVVDHTMQESHRFPEFSGFAVTCFMVRKMIEIETKFSCSLLSLTSHTVAHGSYSYWTSRVSLYTSISGSWNEDTFKTHDCIIQKVPLSIELVIVVGWASTKALRLFRWRYLEM